MSEPAIPAWWTSLAESPSTENITETLGFLCDSEACREILRRIATSIVHVEITHNQYRPEEPELRCDVRIEDGDTKPLVFKLPDAIDASVPESFARILRHAKASFDLYGGGFFLAPFGDQDWDDWEAWFEEYATDFLGVTILPVLSSGSDQFVYHPTLKRANGEPQIVWLAHDGGGYDPIPEPELGAGGVFLRVLDEAIAGGDDRQWFL